MTAVVYADVPLGWTVVSSSYSGTVNGLPASGTGTLVTTDPGACPSLPSVAPGYQRLYFTAGPFPNTLGSDSANLSVTFLVGGSAGSYTLSFSGSALPPPPQPPPPSPPSSNCQATPSTFPVTVNAQAIPAVGTLGAAVFAALLLLAAGVILRRALSA